MCVNPALIHINGIYICTKCEYFQKKQGYLISEIQKLNSSYDAIWLYQGFCVQEIAKQKKERKGKKGHSQQKGEKI